jgi:hypothetical protein
MNWIALLATFCVFLFVARLIYFYASKTTNWYVYTFVFIGWFLAFGIVVLIPFDVHAAISENLDEDELSSLHISWRVAYWTV